MEAPVVSIITRTRDRPVLLARAVESVLGQENAPAWEWIVVNDGGNPGTVEAVLQPARKTAGDRVRILHLAESAGMEHASNQGITKSDGRLLAIHDDDDSWDSAFLFRMNEWLEAPDHAGHAGVVCQSIRIEESVEADRITIHHEEPFNPWLEELTAWRILEENPFPPISFLFRRSAWEAVGPFDESLPVLGDWEFNIRLILRYPIGVLPLPLARYHHRVSGAAGSLANSITAGHGRHREYEQRLRQRWQEHPPMKGLRHFGELARIAGASKVAHGRLQRLLSLPLRPGPQV